MNGVVYDKKLGWEVPRGTFPCWIISDADRLMSLKQNKPFYDYKPSCYFKITRQLDNNFLEGHLGHTSDTGNFHDNILNNYTYFAEYQQRLNVHFSFDRVTLYRLITIHPTSPLTFILKRVDSPKAIKPNNAFMIMPFKYKNLNELYKNHIKNFLLKEMEIQIFRADDFDGNDIIIDTIYNQIDESEFIIADTSHPNKNVFYEFGYAAAKEKEIITIQNSDVDESLFFDRVHIRAVLYSLKNIPDFQRQLKNTINAIRDKVSAKN
jgi:hypothetical protein